mgnify:CR=1 FL=1
MSLDKIDLIDRKFSQSLFGYCRDDVDRLVAEAAETIGRLAEEKMALVRTVAELRREMGEYQARESTLRDTLLTTQTIVKDLKAKAIQEADGILEAARDKAAALIRQAEEQAAAKTCEIDALRLRKTRLAARFREMLLAALDILDNESAADTQEAGEQGASTGSTPLAGSAVGNGMARNEIPIGLADAMTAVSPPVVVGGGNACGQAGEK